jgi:putative tryptophan/tyrosine transport system substrate-binding protein
VSAKIKRRAFITLLGGAAASWPLAARAQQPERMRRIGFIQVVAENDPEAQARITAFQQGLAALDWVEGRNIRIIYRFAAAGDAARIQTHVAELVSSAPDLIVAGGTPVIAALKQATSTIPIVFAIVNDPVGQGFITSLARPGGNITGFTFIEFEMVGKWLELLKEMAPAVRRAALIFNPETGPFYPVFLRQFGAVPASIGTELAAAPVHSRADLEATIATLTRESDGGLIVAADAFNAAHRPLIMQLVERHRLPSIYYLRQAVVEGGLMSYGPDLADIVRRSASYVDRILRGANPADLPVQQPTKFELAINLKTAKALGLTVPPTLLARADEVIE